MKSAEFVAAETHRKVWNTPVMHIAHVASAENLFHALKTMGGLGGNADS